MFHAAWKALKQVLGNEQQYQAAANMVLYTWDQKQNTHVHIHAVVPGGGPSLTKTKLGGSDVDCNHDSPRHRLPACRGVPAGRMPFHRRTNDRTAGGWSTLMICDMSFENSF